VFLVLGARDGILVSLDDSVRGGHIIHDGHTSVLEWPIDHFSSIICGGRFCGSGSDRFIVPLLAAYLLQHVGCDFDITALLNILGQWRLLVLVTSSISISPMIKTLATAPLRIRLTVATKTILLMRSIRMHVRVGELLVMHLIKMPSTV